MNSVVILFITDLDEMLWDILTVVNSSLVDNMSPKKVDAMKALKNENAEMKAEMEKMKDDMQDLQTKMNKLLGIETPSTAPALEPQDGPAAELEDDIGHLKFLKYCEDKPFVAEKVQANNSDCWRW